MLYLHIVWFVEQPKIETIVVTGNKLELSCRAEAEPGVTVNYKWFKCLKKDGIHKKPTGHKGNRMIISMCDNTNEGYYMCEASAIYQSINSIVAHVKIVNSTSISITIEPSSDICITLGETLTLKCEASCELHPVKYQWYNEAGPITGATQSILKIPAVSEENIGRYYCEVTSEYSATKAKSKLAHVRSM